MPSFRASHRVACASPPDTGNPDGAWRQVECGGQGLDAGGVRLGEHPDASGASIRSRRRSKSTTRPRACRTQRRLESRCAPSSSWIGMPCSPISPIDGLSVRRASSVAPTPQRDEPVAELLVQAQRRDVVVRGHEPDLAHAHRRQPAVRGLDRARVRHPARAVRRQPPPRGSRRSPPIPTAQVSSAMGCPSASAIRPPSPIASISSPRRACMRPPSSASRSAVAHGRSDRRSSGRMD